MTQQKCAIQFTVEHAFHHLLNKSRAKAPHIENLFVVLTPQYLIEDLVMCCVGEYEDVLDTLQVPTAESLQYLGLDPYQIREAMDFLTEALDNYVRTTFDPRLVMVEILRIDQMALVSCSIHTNPLRLKNH